MNNSKSEESLRKILGILRVMCEEIEVALDGIKKTEEEKDIEELNRLLNK